MSTVLILSPPTQLATDDGKLIQEKFVTQINISRNPEHLKIPIILIKKLCHISCIVEETAKIEVILITFHPAMVMPENEKHSKPGPMHSHSATSSPPESGPPGPLVAPDIVYWYLICGGNMIFSTSSILWNILGVSLWQADV